MAKVRNSTSKSTKFRVRNNPNHSRLENHSVEQKEQTPKVEEENVWWPVEEEKIKEKIQEVVEEDKVQEEKDKEEDKPEEEDKPISTVVAEKFKLKYIENARANNIPHKAARRSNWDWLAQQIASFCLDEKQHIRMDDFFHLLEANGVDHNRWTNRNKGWEGRIRMTGRVALQRVVAANNTLKFPGNTEVTPPAEWVSQYKAKQ